MAKHPTEKSLYDKIYFMGSHIANIECATSCANRLARLSSGEVCHKPTGKGNYESCGGQSPAIIFELKDGLIVRRRRYKKCEAPLVISLLMNSKHVPVNGLLFPNLKLSLALASRSVVFSPARAVEGMGVICATFYVCHRWECDSSFGFSR
jgi:hypothetical protein